MSGVLENMQGAIVALQQEVAALKAAMSAAPAAAANPFAPPTAAAAAPAVPANVTDEQIVQLITPHLENDAIKAALGAEMRAMGINALPEAQPHQYSELYGRFQRVIAAGAAAAPAAATSII